MSDESMQTVTDSQQSSRPSAGQQLRAVREHSGITVATVAKTLNVSVAVLDALERDDYAYFAAPVFARGYLKKYAAFLSLSETELLAAYDAQQDTPADPSLIPSMKLPTPNRLEPLLRPGLMILATVILLGGVVFFVFHGPLQWLDNEVNSVKEAPVKTGVAPLPMVAPSVHADVKPDQQTTEVAVSVVPPQATSAEH